MSILSRLTARNFRNLIDVDVDLSAGMNLLTGRNGQGKSNVLEAICYLGLLRSFRTHRVSDLVHWDATSFVLQGAVTDQDPAFSFQMSVSQGQKRLLRLNGNPLPRASDFINRFICVPLVPEDIELIKGPASVRRRFLDIALSQQHGDYIIRLQQYRDALRNRNALLRNSEGDQRRVMAVYDDLLIEHGSRVEAARRQYVRSFSRSLAETSAELLESEDLVYTVRYQCAGIPRDADATNEQQLVELLQEALDKSRERDTRDGYTTVGPHRGELAVYLRGKPLADFGSEGECRLGSLALRLASLREVQQQNREERCVVVLVDDVIGELDEQRKETFLKAVQDVDQVVLTATDVPRALESSCARHFVVQDGTLESA